ncbi:MAG: serine/threonine protein kinase [Proteobacteria bacterium]|nr:serine/threonine protein kinase [Pseudomonadota bacterium]
MIGEVVGSYRVVAKVGEGTTSVVYLAEHALMGRRAAVKVFSSSSGSEPFLARAQKAATLTHPGLVEVFDLGDHKGKAYLVMEFLDGESLATRIGKRGNLPFAQALGIARQLTAALAVVHDADIVHGNLTPDHVVLVPDAVVTGGERAKLLDTGLTHSTPDSPEIKKAAAYMAPEQLAEGLAIDHRADLYALGCILFEMLCGRPPFVADKERGSVTSQQIHDEPPPLRQFEPSLRRDVESLVRRLLAKRPDDRPPSAIEVSAIIDKSLDGHATARMSTHGMSESAPVSVSFDSKPAPVRAPIEAEEASSRPERSRVLTIGLAALIGTIVLAAVLVVATC